jgi:hypothetical protein
MQNPVAPVREQGAAENVPEFVVQFACSLETVAESYVSEQEFGLVISSHDHAVVGGVHVGMTPDPLLPVVVDAPVVALPDLAVLPTAPLLVVAVVLVAEPPVPEAVLFCGQPANANVVIPTRVETKVCLSISSP